MTSKRLEYRTALNALRGFAALYVVFYHLRYFTTVDWFGTVPSLRYGYIGVDFFFILSGLIISHVYLHKSIQAPLKFWTEFLWLRISRLLPVHLLIMLLLLLVALVGPVFDKNQLPLTTQQWTDWFSLAMLFRQWLLPDGYAWNAPAWSVSAELFAYSFIFPMIAACAVQFNHHRLAIGLISIGLYLFLMIVCARGTVNVTSGAYPLLRVVAGFLTGSGLFLLFENSDFRVKWDLALGWTLAASVPIFGLGHWIDGLAIPFDLILILYLVALISVAYSSNGYFAKLLSSRPLFWSGEISFSLYLCHVPVLGFMSYLAEIVGIERGFLFGLAGIICSVAVAHALYTCMEIPARDRMRNWYQRFLRRTDSMNPSTNLS